MTTHPTDQDEFYWTCIEEAFDEVSIYDGPEVLAAGLHEFPEWIGDLLCVHWLLCEYLNGGLQQFFENSTGVLAPEAIAGLRRMGLPQAADSIRQAVAIFGSQYPHDKRDRYNIMRAKAGVQPEDMEIMISRARLFKTMEDQLEEIGGPGMEVIYRRMNEYAMDHAADTHTKTPAAQHQEDFLKLAPRLALDFLLELHPRDPRRKRMPGLKDSAIFYRLWGLFNTLQEPELAAELNDEQKEAARAFHLVMERLPWQVVLDQPDTKELPGDDLKPLVEAGRHLYHILKQKDTELGAAPNTGPPHR